MNPDSDKTQMEQRPRIDQLLSGFAPGDAISQEALIMRSLFLNAGYDSDIYAVNKSIATEVTNECKQLWEYKGREGDRVIHHYSLYSEAAPLYLESQAKKIMRYHNITPAGYFRGFDDKLFLQLSEGRQQLKNTVAATDTVWATSAFNLQELEKFEPKHATILPLLFDPKRFERPVDPTVKTKFRRKLKTLLFVGRMVPNKKIEDLILMFAWFNKVIDSQSRLVLVGSEHSCPRYYTMLRMLTASLDLPNVCFEGYASEAQLAGYYQAADVFVCTSEHEGYCLPLVEAMFYGVPVIARRAGGMPEALNGAGVLYDKLCHQELAELVNLLLTDKSLKKDALDSQTKRMAELNNRDAQSEIIKLLEDV
ncbi:MAG: glycosyltransferase family 4 protein [Lentisphaerae bacterium]|nr:glycosyltransferase family 4 protein [Lentisphaerota bacterium]